MTEDIDTRFCEFDLHRSTPSLSNFAPKWPTSCWFEHWRHSTANCGHMVTDSATVTMESLYETTIALLNGAITDSLQPPVLPKWGSLMHCPQSTLCLVLQPCEYDRKVMLPVARLLWLCWLYNTVRCNWDCDRFTSCCFHCGRIVIGWVLVSINTIVDTSSKNK